MNRELRTLKEVVAYLTAISDTVESIRKRASRYDKENIYKAQEYLVASISHFQNGMNTINTKLKEKTKEEGDQNG